MSISTNQRHIGFVVGTKGGKPLVAVEDPCNPARRLGPRVGTKGGKPLVANGPCQDGAAPTTGARYHGVVVGEKGGKPLVAMRCTDCVPTCSSAKAYFGVGGCVGGLNNAEVTVTKGAFSATCTTTTSPGFIDGYCQIDLGAEGAGTYTWTVTHPSGRFAAASGSFTLSSPSACHATVSVTLTPASGYVCAPCCNMPLPEMLYLDDKYGTTTLTYTNVGGPHWVGCNPNGPASEYHREWDTPDPPHTCEIVNGGLGPSAVFYSLHCTFSSPSTSTSFYLVPSTYGCGGGVTTPPGPIYGDCDYGGGCSDPTYPSAIVLGIPNQSSDCDDAVDLIFTVASSDGGCLDEYWIVGDTFEITE